MALWTHVFLCFHIIRISTSAGHVDRKWKSPGLNKSAGEITCHSAECETFTCPDTARCDLSHCKCFYHSKETSKAPSAKLSNTVLPKEALQSAGDITCHSAKCETFTCPDTARCDLIHCKCVYYSKGTSKARAAKLSNTVQTPQYGDFVCMGIMATGCAPFKCPDTARCDLKNCRCRFGRGMKGDRYNRTANGKQKKAHKTLGRGHHHRICGSSALCPHFECPVTARCDLRRCRCVFLGDSVETFSNTLDFRRPLKQ